MRKSALNKTIQEAASRIVSAAKPARVLLFGSAVNGTMTKDSDLDFLVIMRGSIHRRQTAQKIYRNLHGLGIAVDIVVATEDDIAKFGSRNGSVLKPALQDGRVIYEA
jgi:predicted nucleotidyltransferase